MQKQVTYLTISAQRSEVFVLNWVQTDPPELRHPTSCGLFGETACKCVSDYILPCAIFKDDPEYFIELYFFSFKVGGKNKQQQQGYKVVLEFLR